MPEVARAALGALFATSCLVACGSSEVSSAPQDAAAADASARVDAAVLPDAMAMDSTSRVKRRVLVIGLDGVRSDALAIATTPTIDRLVAEGAWTFDASTQRSTIAKSAPGWASILTGVDADKHGIQDNGDFDSRDPTFLTFLERGRRAGLRPGVVTNWIGILTLVEDAAEADLGLWIPVDQVVATRVAETVVEGELDVLFAHLDEVDAAGHASGFDPTNPAYLSEIEEKDTQIGLMLDAVESRVGEEWAVFITTDHGGEGMDHGPMTPANQQIFFIAWGAGIAAGEVRTPVHHMAAATSALWYLGLGPDPTWGLDGEIVGMP